MKILIATGIYPPDIGGPATYSKTLFDELPKKGVGVSVLSFSEVRHLPYIIRHIVYFFKILINSKGVDIIYAQDPLGAGVPAGLASKVLRKKFVIKIVGDRAWETGKQKFGIEDTLDDFSKNKSYSFCIRILKNGQLFSTRLADKIITPSYYLKKIIQNWGVDGNKIKVVYNSFDILEGIEDKESIKKTLSFNGKYIVSVGRLVPWKGFDTLINLIPSILKKFPNAKLLIIGDGPEKKKLCDSVDKLELRENVVFLGSVNHKTLLHHIRASDIFVLNTGYEGFSHVLLEAMALGTPIVTTSVGGNVELIKDKQNGLLVEYNNSDELVDAVLKLLTDDFLAENLARNAKNNVMKFSRERMIDELVKELS
jgi:glycosyltransferase involved in cell wall biosynthesis